MEKFLKISERDCATLRETLSRISRQVKLIEQGQKTTPNHLESRMDIIVESSTKADEIIKNLDYIELKDESNEFLSQYNSPENIGSSHWLRTILSNAKHCAEFIENNPSHTLVATYSKTIQDACKDLIKAEELGLIECKK